MLFPEGCQKSNNNKNPFSNQMSTLDRHYHAIVQQQRLNEKITYTNSKSKSKFASFTYNKKCIYIIE